MRLFRYQVFIDGIQQGPIWGRYLTRRGAQRRADQLNNLRSPERQRLVRYEVRRL